MSAGADLPGDYSGLSGSVFEMKVSTGKKTRIVCVQVRTRPVRDGLDAALRGLSTAHF